MIRRELHDGSIVVERQLWKRGNGSDWEHAFIVPQQDDNTNAIYLLTIFRET